jgi:phage gp37-like protein
MAVTLAGIEDAMLARIAGAGLKYLRTAATYAGELDDDLVKAVRCFPAVWIALKGLGEGQALNTARSVYRVPATWAVLVGARALRNEASGRHGDKVNVGTYQMLEDVRALLAGQDFGLEIDNLRPGKVTNLTNSRFQGQGVSIYAQEWHTRFDLRTAERDTGASPAEAPLLPELGSMGIRYHLMPDDGVADAVDLITLQEGRASGQE